MDEYTAFLIYKTRWVLWIMAFMWIGLGVAFFLLSVALNELTWGVTAHSVFNIMFGWAHLWLVKYAKKNLP